MCQDTTAVHHIDFVRDGHDEFHVMLDEHNGDVARFQVNNVMLEFFCFTMIKSCGRFIQEDGMRIIDHRTGKFDKLLLPIGERSGKPLRMMRNAKFF